MASPPDRLVAINNVSSCRLLYITFLEPWSVALSEVGWVINMDVLQQLDWHAYGAFSRLPCNLRRKMQTGCFVVSFRVGREKLDSC